MQGEFTKPYFRELAEFVRSEYFSVNDGVPFPPSLQNIFKEIQLDLGTPIPASGNLTRWARQGVLLLNATLTVREHVAGSHQRKGWETFTDAAIKALNAERDHLVFILWVSETTWCLSSGEDMPVAR